jgi:hypothetical protein
MSATHVAPDTTRELRVRRIPRTSMLGAILLTGYPGGAVATHASPLLTNVLFPTDVGALLWGRLLLREARLGELFPCPISYRSAPCR